MPAQIKPLVAAAAAMSCIAIGAPPAQAAGPGCGSVVTKSTTLQRGPHELPGRRAGDRRRQPHARPRRPHDRRHRGRLRRPASGSPAIAASRSSAGRCRSSATACCSTPPTATPCVRVTVTRSVGRGIQLQNGSDGNRLEFDVSSDNGSSGFGLLASDRNVVTHATGSGNAFSGLQGFGASGNRVVDGTFAGNTDGDRLARRLERQPGDRQRDLGQHGGRSRRSTATTT